MRRRFSSGWTFTGGEADVAEAMHAADHEETRHFSLVEFRDTF